MKNKGELKTLHMEIIQIYKMVNKIIHWIGFLQNIKNVLMISLKRIHIVKLDLLILNKLQYFKSKVINIMVLNKISRN